MTLVRCKSLPATLSKYKIMDEKKSYKLYITFTEQREVEVWAENEEEAIKRGYTVISEIVEFKAINPDVSVIK